MNYADLFRVTLPETALEIAALIVLIVDLGFLRKAALKVRVAVAALLGVAGCGVALWALQASAGAGYSYDGAFLLAQSGYIAAAQSGILILTSLTLLLLIDSDFTKHVGEFVAVVLMAASGGLLVAAAQDLLVIFVGLELLSLSLYIMTAFAKSSAKSAEAALKYYLFGGMSAAFLLLGFSYLYGITGSTNLNQVFSYLSTDGGGSFPLLIVAVVLVFSGLGFKVAAVPFYLWAPDTYEGAPAPAAAFIASVSKVASFTLLLTIGFASEHILISYPAGTSWWTRFGIGLGDSIGSLRFELLWMIILVVSASLSMVVGNLAALAQTNVRRLLAYSAVAHAGYLLIGLPFSNGEVVAHLPFSNLDRTTNAVLYYILTYGLTTIGAFGVVSVVERATGSDRLDSFLGLHKRNPLLAAVLGVLFLSLAGIPPLVGFWAKFNLFAAVLGVSAGPVPFALVALAVAMSAVSLYYYLQVLKRAYVMPAVDETPIKAHPVTMGVLVAIAAAVVVLGCFPALLQRWIESFYPIL
jgi:NADH-quinone oxidoreductase subunit N